VEGFDPFEEDHRVHRNIKAISEEYRWQLVKDLEAIASATHDMPAKTKLLAVIEQLRTV
jgi:hypothetical protein